MARRIVSLVPLIAALAMVAVASPGSGQTVPPAKPAAPQPPAPAPAPVEPADDVTDDPWEERKIRAREDVAYLEALQKAKQAECRESELRVATFTRWQADLARQKQKGLTTPFQLNITDVNLAEYQSEMEMRRVEQKDIEIRLARARRKLRAVERSGAVPEAESVPNDDRIRELEIKVERLRKEMERASRFTETSRHRELLPPH
ncbi:hypothetical protein TA3x_005495 [Tundrisphaera sp. TA3]|uniref:hypothetical protein n=1 Tax=Tundrisphaera sp. TA3 TaxID=3435775 RepID=UPI003EC15075